MLASFLCPLPKSARGLPLPASRPPSFVHQHQHLNLNLSISAQAIRNDSVGRPLSLTKIPSLTQSSSQLSTPCDPREPHRLRENKAIDSELVMSAAGPASVANNKGSSLAELTIDFAESLRLDVDLNNVGSRFHDQGHENGADRYPAAATVEDGYDYGSLAASARLADEVDDITQQTTRASLEDSPVTGAVGPAHDANFYNKHCAQQRPVYTSWQPRCTKTDTIVTPSLDDLPVQRRAVGSSLAPQSSSEGSVNEAPRPAPAQEKRPSHDNRLILPANPVQYQHLPRPHEEPPVAAQPPRIAHAPQPQPQIAPRPLQFAPQNTEDYGCSECGKVFNRKSDLV